MSFYYDDLSVGNESDHGSLSSNDDKHDDESTSSWNEDQEWLVMAAGNHRRRRRHATLQQRQDEPSKYSTLATGLWDRCILHLDIDCFYCQCEEIDRNLRDNNNNNNNNNNNTTEPSRPLAIGQKHIIVTCNYTARKYGVQKLQSREAAYAACPSLWIVEGSDLRQYRRHSRAVYEAFRKALQEIANEIRILHQDQDEVQDSFRIPAKKGCMDEMMADFTPAIERILLQGHGTASKASGSHDPEQEQFIFGEDSASSMAVLVEDQTGQTSIVSFQPSPLDTLGGTSGEGAFTMDPQEASLAAARRNIHNTCGASDQDRFECQRRLQIAADLTKRVCHFIRQRTGFHTTGGLSVSPLLAKLASGLHKPKSINLLYPWRSSQLLYSMPLRKMHMVGRGTMKALEQEMTTSSSDDVFLSMHSSHGNSEDIKKEDTKMRTVRDLLEMPRSSICQALQGMAAFQVETSNQEQCDFLIQQCRGLDTSEIVDDEGGLPKTVSVENSFRRGTVCTLEAVNAALEDLYRRLPLLLQDRTSWATDPEKAYPTTIRLTIRMVDQQLALRKKRRPYVTKSKQASIDGKRSFLQESMIERQSQRIQQYVKPLLQQLLPTVINVTRINIAVTNFQDVATVNLKGGAGQVTLAEAMERKRSMSQSQVSQLSQSMSLEVDHTLKRHKCRPTPAHTKHVSPNFTPRSPTLATSNPSHRGQRPSQRGRMKATRIDHFFFKK